MTRLGSFEMLNLLGRGGMAEVWRARQVRTGVEVAVKVATTALSESGVEAFEREVRAHASLNHPAIVHLFDYGFVSDEDARRSDGAWQVGTPYLAMELADHGTIRTNPPMDWPSLRTLISAVLDALAHAHARDVIHRDLKPDNLLVFGDEPLRLKLTDFGIAHAVESEARLSTEELNRFAGTPRYMPPEQARGRWREYGPWTDLYALGCIVWELTCGAPVFGGDTPVQVVMQHLQQERPDFEPKFRVPPQFEEWLRTCLRRDKSLRFGRAADALAALPRGRVTAVETGPRLHVSPNAATVPFSQMATLPFGDTHWGGATSPARDNATGAEPPRVSALPDTWRKPRTGAPSDLWVGTGLSLFGLREIPFVDRDEVRTLLWEELRETVESGELRTVFLTGGPGVGKSTIANWVATRADEVGIARRVAATHSPSGSGPLDGLRGAARRVFRAHGLARRETYEHLLDRFSDTTVASPEYMARALTEWLDPSPDDAHRFHQFANARERFALAERLLRHLAADRAVLLVLDDLQWARGSVDMLQHLILHRFPLKTLVIATVRDDIVAEDAALSERFEELYRQEECSRIRLAPLGEDDHRKLLAGMLNMEEELLETVARRTEGNPLFATQLLRHLIDRRQVEVGEDGFRPVEPDVDVVPSDIFELWAERIDRLVQTFPPGRHRDVRTAIEIAAALGRRIDLLEWNDATRLAGVEVPRRLLPRLMNLGLAHRTDAGFGFAHGMLVDSIAERSRISGRWSDIHRYCAEMLDERADLHGESAARRARHRELAGELEVAAELTLEAGREALGRGEHPRVIELFGRHMDLLDRSDAPPCDRRRVAGWLSEAQARMNMGDKILAEELEQRAARCLSGRDEPRLEAELQFGRSQRMFLAGRVRDSEEPMQRALELYRSLGDEREVTCLQRLGFRAYRLGEHGRAIRLFRTALQKATPRGQAAAHSHRQLGAVLSAIGRLAEARRHLEIARNTYEDHNQVGLAHIEVHLGDLARSEGDLEAARAWYRQALPRFEGVASIETPIVRVNLGLVAHELGDAETAATLWDRARSEAEQSGYPFAEFCAATGQALNAVCRRDRSGARDLLAQVTRMSRGLDVFEEEVADIFDEIARDARAVGWNDVAATASELANEQRKFG